MKHSIGLALLAGVAVVGAATPAAAERVITNVNVDLSRSSIPFGIFFGDGEISFGANDDPFNVVTVATAGAAQVSAFFGEPSSSFTDRGPVVYGPDFGMFSSFPDRTTVRFTNGDNFIGLKTTSRGQDFYGFVYTTNSVLNSYGFETVAGRAITATTEQAAAVPEPAAWAMMVFGFGAVGYGLRRRRRGAVRVAFAA